jgi:hypothetical protein
MVDAAAWHGFERNVMLQSLDTHWREHLSALDHLRQGIHLRGYAQKNPKQEYKREAFELFENLLNVVRTEVTKLLMTVQIRSEAQLEEAEAPPELENVQYHHAGYDEALATANPDRGAAEPEPRGTQGWPQRPVSLRFGQEVQALPRQTFIRRVIKLTARADLATAVLAVLSTAALLLATSTRSLRFSDPSP